MYCTECGVIVNLGINGIIDDGFIKCDDCGNVERHFNGQIKSVNGISYEYYYESEFSDETG